LLGLAFFFLEVAANEDVEKLVGSADFDVRPDFYGIPALHDWVLQLVEADFLTCLEASAEVLALEHLLESDTAVELEDFLVSHFAEPVAVVNDFSFRAVEDFEGLVRVGGGVDEDLVASEGRAGRRAAGWVANGGGEVADEKDRLVAEELKLAELLKRDRVAEVDVWRGGIDSEFDAERAAKAEFFQEFFFGKDLGGAGGELGKLVFGRHFWTPQSWRVKRACQVRIERWA
jgi:hypothetical protein